MSSPGSAASTSIAAPADALRRSSSEITDQTVQRGPAPTAPRPRSAAPVPLVPVAAALMLGLALGDALGLPSWTYAAVAVTAAFAALFTVSASSRWRRRLALCAVLALAIATGALRLRAATTLPMDHIARLAGDERRLVRVIGTVVEPPRYQPAERRNPFMPFAPPARTSLLLETQRIVSSGDAVQPIRGLLRATVDAERLDLAAGDRVRLTGWLSGFDVPRNPGEFDWRAWNARQGVHARLFVDGPQYVQHLGAEASLLHTATTRLRDGARRLLIDDFDHVAPDDAPSSLLETMVLGQRSAATRAVNDAFLRTGAMHFLSVSGFHVGVLWAAAWLVLRTLLRCGPRFSAVGAATVLVVYLFVAEQNAPVFRAVVTGVVAAAALLLNRPRVWLNWLALAAIVILLIQPLDLFRAGFQLSFFQVLVLLTIVPLLRRLLSTRRDDGEPQSEHLSYWQVVRQRMLGWGAAITLISVVAWLAALPLVLWHFGRFAPWGWAQSMLITPVATLVILSGFLALLIGWIPGVGALLHGAVGLATAILQALVAALGQVPGALLESAPPPAWLVFASYGLLGLIAWRVAVRQARERRDDAGAGLLRWALPSAAGLLLVWAGWVVLPPGNARGVYTLDVLSVGSGSANLLVAPGREAWLLDCGTIANFDAGRVALGACGARGVRRLTGLMVSHANFDHYSGMPTVAAALGSRQFASSALFDIAAQHDAGVRRLLETHAIDRATQARWVAGQRVHLDDAVELEVLWPPADLDPGWSENDRSVVLRLSVGTWRVLLPGDIEKPALEALLRRQADGRCDLRADILVAPHHGAVVGRATADFLAAVQPRWILVSTSYRRDKLYDVVQETLGPGCVVLSTHESGALQVALSPTGLSVRPFVAEGAANER